MLSNGMVNLTRGAEKQGVSWKSDQFQAFDNGTFIEEIHAGNQTEFQRSRGLVAFGTVDERNVFHMSKLDRLLIKLSCFYLFLVSDNLEWSASDLEIVEATEHQ